MKGQSITLFKISYKDGQKYMQISRIYCINLFFLSEISISHTSAHIKKLYIFFTLYRKLIFNDRKFIFND